MKRFLSYALLPFLFVSEMLVYAFCEHQSIPLVSIGYLLSIYTNPSIIQQVLGIIFIGCSLSIQGISLATALFFIIVANIAIYLARLWLYPTFWLGFFLTFLLEIIYLSLQQYPWTARNFGAIIIVIWCINLFCIRLVRQSRE